MFFTRAFSEITLLFISLFLSIAPQISSPQFVVKELEACCHHQIHLKCESSDEIIGIIQSRYLAPSYIKNPSQATIPIQSQTSGMEENSKLHNYLSLRDMDLKFSHDLSTKKSSNSYALLNTPEWAKERIKFYQKPLIKFYTPKLIGSNFSTLNKVEIPMTKNEENEVGKDDVLSQPLFPMVNEENKNGQNFQNRTRNIRFGRGENAQPCYSYDYLTQDEKKKIEQLRERPKWEYRDLRPVFNQRCSGKSECVVNLLRNKMRDQDLTSVCQKWPEGRITIKYLCLNTSSNDVHRKCDADLENGKEGFIMSPGYPRLYHGDFSCHWKLSLNSTSQKILLLFLDISLRGEEKSKCVDEVIVSDDKTKLLSTCGDHSSALALLSLSHRLNITLSPLSRLAFPKRGFLLYYRPLGCGTPPEPLNSYLVFRNFSNALFMCEPGFSLSNTFSRHISLACNSLNHSWSNNNSSLICRETGMNLNISDPFNFNDDSFGFWPSESEPIMNAIIFRDLIVPVILIVLLLLTNFLIIFWIKRRKKTLISVHEEFKNEMDEKFEVSSSCNYSEKTPEDSTFTLSSEEIEFNCKNLAIGIGGEPKRTWTHSQFSTNNYENFSILETKSIMDQNYDQMTHSPSNDKKIKASPNEEFSEKCKKKNKEISICETSFLQNIRVQNRKRGGGYFSVPLNEENKISKLPGIRLPKSTPV